jgi:hypothetical protein
MVSLSLSELKLHQKLIRKSQNDPVAAVLHGLTVSLTGDANEFLGFVRTKFPSYTGHDLQHSWRILKRIEDILSFEAIEKLTAVEIFALIIAAAFHDVGMITEGLSTNELRKIHHIRSEEFLNAFLIDRMASVSEYLPRLVPCIAFIARAHGMTMEEMTSSEFFKRNERIFEQQLRVKVLAILLRVGDLLDLDSDRTCDPLRRFTPYYFKDITSVVHHRRHKNVSHFFISYESIEVEVVSQTKDEHTIWAEWLGYLKQDILYANTYVFKGVLSPFQLPKLVDQIIKSNEATYELWPLRFEIDEKGKIWDILSQSIYTGKFDFIRELLQNSIDACLRWIYVCPTSIVKGCNPKHWSLENYEPGILVAYSATKNRLTISDNGIGMDKYTLTKFLFNVASSGYKNESIQRTVQFPAIAKFGIGFVSCLVRADRIVIKTRSRESETQYGREIVLKTEALDAYSEIIDCQPGTEVMLFLKTRTSFDEIRQYISSNFYSPSIKIILYNEDLLTDLLGKAGLDSSEQHTKLFATRIKSKNLADLIKHSNQRPAQTSLINHEKIYFKVHPKKIDYQPRLTIPLFLHLDDSFRIIGISKLYKSDLNEFDTSLLIIPAFMNDLEMGIEWTSIHIFLINRSTHRRTLIRLQDGEDTFILNQSEWDDEMIEWEDYYSEDDEEAILALNDVYYETNARITQKPNAIITSNCEGRDEMQYHLLQNMNTVSLKNYGNSATREKIIARIDDLIMRELKGFLFQDGIKLPIDASSIAPLGTTHARCNLFGPSRLELNITRNSINESNTLLSNWMTSAGKKIQKLVLRNVLSTFESNNIIFDANNLIIERNSDKADILFEYSCPMLKTVLNLSSNTQKY